MTSQPFDVDAFDVDAFAAEVSAARHAVSVEPAVTLGRALFIGSGDSLASGGVAVSIGHAAMSSGDITWAGRVPPGVDTVVGISHSGTSGATVRAIRLAREAGLRTVAVTSQPTSPLASAAQEVRLVPVLQLHEPVPYTGHIMLALGVAGLCGVDTASASRYLEDSADAIRKLAHAVTEELPATNPGALSILTLPDLRSAGEFWSLKFIEATGLSARSVPLEESGHVDYFIGPQHHLTLGLVGTQGTTRFEQLSTALITTGQQVVQVDATQLVGSDDASADLAREIALAVVGSLVSHGAAARWDRPPFRGGAVDMSAKHIKIEE